MVSLVKVSVTKVVLAMVEMTGLTHGCPACCSN